MYCAAEALYCVCLEAIIPFAGKERITRHWEQAPPLKNCRVEVNEWKTQIRILGYTAYAECQQTGWELTSKLLTGLLFRTWVGLNV